MEQKGRLFTGTNPSVIQIHKQLAHLADIRHGAPSFDGLDALPAPDQLAVFLETAFWASLKTDEGRTTAFAATLAAREDVPGATILKDAVPYHENQVAKIAPALFPAGCIGVSMGDAGFSIWGFARGLPGSWVNSVTVLVSEPGVLRVSVGPFQPFAVLDGRSDPILASTNSSLAFALDSALGKPLPMDDMLEKQAVWRERIAITDLARMILGDGHGGALLIVSGQSGDWEQSIEFAYRFSAADSAVPDVIRRELSDAHDLGEQIAKWSQLDLPDEIKNAGLAMSGSTQRLGMTNLLRPIASLAAVDGAVVITKDLRVLGCGAKIHVANDVTSTVCIVKPLSGNQEIDQAPLERIGGTRHQSAARFVGAHHDAVGLVISQDRHLSLLRWHEEVNSVLVIRNAEWWA